jgi:hypothetical protein
MLDRRRLLGLSAAAAAGPPGSEIAEELWTRMYAVDHRDLALALEDYARIGGGAAPCPTCAQQACLGACPFRLPIPVHTCDAATRLG